LLRACAPTAFQDDPLRVMRAVRLAAAYRLRILPETLAWMRAAAPRLADVSPERRRDELFRLLEGPQPHITIETLDRVGGLAPVLPELEALKGVNQSAPHIHDVWTHTFEVIRALGGVLDALSFEPVESNYDNLRMGLVSMRLGRYRPNLSEHLAAALNPQRSLRGLLVLAALYHDIAKPQTRSVEAGGRVRFFEHEAAGAQIAAQRARELRLSNDEILRLELIVRGHLRPILLAQMENQPPSPRAVYRYFRAVGPAGVDIALLSMADVLGAYGVGLPTEIWSRHLDVIRTLLEAWWERPHQAVTPPTLINGNDLMTELGLKPGREIGRLLELVREAQVGGQATTRQEALALARASLLDNSKPD
jgi:putative nucleotidyltransferase with HDIG domain